MTFQFNKAELPEVPPRVDEIFQRLLLLSRHRTNLVEDLARVKNRIQKTLEDGNVKFEVITSDVFGKSGLQVLRKIAKG